MIQVDILGISFSQHCGGKKLTDVNLKTGATYIGALLQSSRKGY